MTLCITQCMDMLVKDMTDNPLLYADILTSWSFKLLPLNEQIVSCNDETACLQIIVEREDYDPCVIGQVVYFEILSNLNDDGWNYLGLKTYDAETGSIVDCTTNCAPYSDTTGYYPRNNPRKRSSKATSKGKAKKVHDNSSDKYIVKGLDKFWQPLLETNNLGNFIRQEHVTPHIGYTAKTLLLSAFKKAKRPNYDYKAEAGKVVTRLKELVGDRERIEMLKFFDKKVFVRFVIQGSLVRRYAPVLSFQDYLLFLSGLSSAEYDATIQVWREKVRFDRVRPTTVIQHWNDDNIYTFSGDQNSTMPQDIKARDFQSFIRVMPHS